MQRLATLHVTPDSLPQKFTWRHLAAYRIGPAKFLKLLDLVAPVTVVAGAFLLVSLVVRVGLERFGAVN